jgi:dCTP deaminase
MTQQVNQSKFSILSNKAILRYMDEDEIVIDPFNPNNLNTSSYDVTLGEYYFREQKNKEEYISNIYNIYSEEHVKRVWGTPLVAKPYSYYKDQGIVLENINDNDKLIFINPGERILGHTQEFIGGKTTVTTMMKARSSTGRNFISVCLCAGMGDIGYYNRWTMEITNNSTNYIIPLVVNRRYAQILFMDTEGIINESSSYNESGKYQKSTDLEVMKKEWSPYDMLPKMYLDREIYIDNFDNLSDSDKFETV